jgi:hypothetical protein
MAISTGLGLALGGALSAGGSLLGGVLGGGGGGGAASQAGWDAYNKSLLAAGSNKAIASPYLFGGYAGTNALLRALGLGHLNPMNTDGGVNSTAYGETSLNTSDVAGDRANALANFQTSPGYNFRLNEGTKALDRSAASKGMLLSGAQTKAVTDYGQNTASNEWGNYINQLFQLSGLGASSAASTNAADTSAYGTGINALTQGQLGSAQLGAAAGQRAGAGIGNALSGIGNILGYGAGAGWFSGSGLDAGAAGIGRAAGGIRPATV